MPRRFPHCHWDTAFCLHRREYYSSFALALRSSPGNYQLDPFAPDERVLLARECLEQGDRAGRREITALAKAKIAYIAELMNICSRFRCKAFASVVNKTSPITSAEHLWNDYAYLFERFFYYLEDFGPSAYGIVVLDELEKVQAICW